MSEDEGEGDRGRAAEREVNGCSQMRRDLLCSDDDVDINTL